MDRCFTIRFIQHREAVPARRGRNGKMQKHEHSGKRWITLVGDSLLSYAMLQNQKEIMTDG